MLIILCVVLLSGCTDEGMSYYLPNEDNADANVTLTLNVSISDSRDDNGTRAEKFDTVPAKNNYELINTLRVIIVREDNTVECNREITLSPDVAVKTFGDLKFQVSTTEGKIDGLLRTEKKRIYLIANEASIQPNPNNGMDVVRYLSGLKAGHYEKVENTTSEVGKTNDDIVTDKPDSLVYVKGDPFSPQTAASLIIYNEWPNGSNGSKPDIAVPYINNEGQRKKYIPMTEFFDIEVTENLKTGLNNKEQVEDLFITRNLVKFQFSITAAPGTTPFKVTEITFDGLMQEEYLFLNGEYTPRKEEGDINSKRQITKFETPGYQGKNKCPYIFKPGNFGFNSASENPEYQDTYLPLLYFCETQTNVFKEGKPDFRVGIDVEYPFTEEVVDKDGKPVLGEDGKPMTQPVTNHFEAQTLGNLPYFIPRNTIVDVKMNLKDGELSAVATVYPYTGVWLNPEFGFSAPETDRLTVAPTMDLVLNGDDGLLYPTFTSTEGNTIQNLYWVSSDPSVVLLGNEVTDESDQTYVKPSGSIELPYLQMVQDKLEPVPVRIIPQKADTTYVTAYTQSGLVARCQVIVKE